ncbi:MAG TPA: adenylate/guanylate cyclase domain-containing protein [Candidatus Limnocylindrales bacterium]|nr:adenylate/guanylate cyclase domain-containing protein [Candidatus Limnocylindrales bacterium]
MAVTRGEPTRLTFLFTDIEGSTRLWEHHPAEMPDALAQHVRILATAIRDAGGSVVKETGDGVFAVFDDARAAVDAAVAAQLGLATATWGVTGVLRARMGLHSGDALREHDDYHGPDVNRSARVMATAHGGQVVVSAATYELAAGAPGVTFRDLGEHRLKDLARPERIRQVVHPDLPADFPPLRSLGSFPNNLPAALSTFVGRRDEVAAIVRAISAARLVTLTGAGGAGKTRLGLQVAAERIASHPDGVWFVDLAGLAEERLVTQELVAVLPVPEQPGSPAIEVLRQHLRDRDLLIVLDNCEHLIESAARVVDDLLRAAPSVRVIATSREPLNVPGEVIWRVPSLSIPDDPADADASSEAIELFVERARAADPTLTLDPGRLQLVASICRRLDGLPLAIELAAARVRALSLEDISDRLDDRFRLLTGGARTALPRQRTLEATVAWSYDLLDPDERQVFARLSVFASSFRLDAAEAVCAGEGIEPAAIPEVITRLVDKSLVSVVQGPTGTRYRLLETLRDFAGNRLAESGDAAVVQKAHARWVLGFTRSSGAEFMGPRQAQIMAELSASLDDLRVVLGRAVEDGDVSTGLSLIVNVAHWWPVAAVREARHWLDQLLPAPSGVDPVLVGNAIAVHGVVLAIQGSMDRAMELQRRALEILEAASDEHGVAWATHYLGIFLWSTDPDEARRATMDALAAFERLRIPAGVLRCLWWLILWELEFGDRSEALRYGSRLRDLAAALPNPLAGAHAAEAAGLLARVVGDLEDARAQFEQAVTLHARVRNGACLAHCLEHVALWSLDRDEAANAALLLGAVDAIREDVVGSTAVPPFERMWHDRATGEARRRLGEERYADAWGRGRQMRLDTAIRAAIAAISGEPAPASPEPAPP